MTYRVQLSRDALKDYKRLGLPIKSKIQTAMDRLQDSPLAGSQVKRLKGKLREYYRYRVEDYRILYFVDKEGKIVYVDIIQHRKDIYRRL